MNRRKKEAGRPRKKKLIMKMELFKKRKKMMVGKQYQRMKINDCHFKEIKK